MSNLSFIREPFTERERAILSNYFTNTDKPVFGLINLPDVVKGALFARYSRSDKSLRRLFLDEFWIDTPDSAGTCTTGGLNTERAGRLYDKMILDFGDDSVAQLGGAHLACEQVSNLLAKFIEKGRIASYLEQSTRYVYYNRKREGRYGYLTSPEIESSSCCALYREFMDALFDTYTDLQQRLIPVFRERYPRTEGMTDGAWENTIKAKACDTIRGLLPASTRTNLGIFANGQYYEYLLIKMFASRNREVLAYADMMLTELRKMIPSFLTRVDLENRGRAWSRYLSDIGDDMERFVPQPGAVLPASPQPNTVELVGWDPDAVRRIVRAILYEYSDRSKTQLDQTVSRLTEPELGQIVRAYCGERLNRRHKPAGPLKPPAMSSTCSRITAHSATSSATACSRSTGSGSPPTTGISNPRSSKSCLPKGPFTTGFSAGRSRYSRRCAGNWAPTRPSTPCPSPSGCAMRSR